MFSNTRKTYTSSNYALDLANLGEVNINDYHGSFLFVMSVKSDIPNFDIADNKYVQVQSNKVETGWVISENLDVPPRKCSEKELKKIFGEWTNLKTLKNSICANSNVKI